MTNLNCKIAIIIPYFGSWPSYFNIFLKGCEHNKWLDIIFLTDCIIPQVHKENLTFIPYTLKKLNDLVNNKLKGKFSISNAYKLCDFRPCYGLIFEDYLLDYDYWGYGDIDLIYGDLEPFIKSRIADGYDVLSSRSEIISGSLSLFKNTYYLKSLYSKSFKLIELLYSSNYEGLDETAHDHSTWKGNNKLNLPNHCFTYLIAKAHADEKIKASFATICKEEVNYKEVINYNDGSLTFSGSSLGYYHYVCNKNDFQYVLPNWQRIPSFFFITQTGFYKNHEFYSAVNLFRKVFGFIRKTSLRIWKRLIK